MLFLGQFCLPGALSSVYKRKENIEGQTVTCQPFVVNIGNIGFTHIWLKK